MSDDHMPEVWGGFECSVVRLGSTYRNQSDETGHAARPDDIDRAHALGIRTLRYPALWETVSPDDPERRDWRWHDARLARLRALGMRPILGLVHHGSGPRYTDLLDPAFPAGLARHAEAVARRYPFVEDWTPVNEPLTTARFSALYGHWYPHRADLGSFLRATVGQCAAIVLAMRAVRRVVPSARLVQTEDLGKTFAVPELAHQARFDNERRWLTLDLLCGRVDRHHPWWEILSRHGIDQSALELFLAGDAAPDVIGVNHYLTSERFLDGDWRRYPAAFKGGNGAEVYADVEAVRVTLPEGDLGPKARLREVIERYGRPVAITEAHHGCTREEQLRWLVDVWDAAATLKAEGADVRAVTVWSLAGAVDWNSLLTSRHGVYEPGAFDVRAPVPRRTALGDAVASLAATGRFAHPTLGQGWWRRPERLYGRPEAQADRGDGTGQPLLVTGAPSCLAAGFAGLCGQRGLAMVVAPVVTGWDGFVAAHRPWAIVDLSGLVAPGGTIAASSLAAAGLRHGLPVLAVSSALVFGACDGDARVEGDRPCPADPEGAGAVETERALLGCAAQVLVVRSGPVFAGPAWSEDPVPLAATGPLAPDSRLSPTFLPDLLHAALDLLIDGERGLWHLANTGQAPWGETATRLAAAAGAPELASRLARAGAPRRGAPLASGRGWIMPPLEGALARFAHDMAQARPAAPQQMAAE